jgi:hypothetical protein
MCCGQDVAHPAARCAGKQTAAAAGSPAAHQVPAAAAKTLDHLRLPAHRLRFPSQVGAMGAPSAARLRTATPGSEKGTLPSSAAVLLGAGRQGRQRQLMACSMQLTAVHASGCQQALVCRQTCCQSRGQGVGSAYRVVDLPVVEHVVEDIALWHLVIADDLSCQVLGQPYQSDVGAQSQPCSMLLSSSL